MIDQRLAARWPKVAMGCDTIVRARVQQRFQAAYEFPITLVVAPAGFGKSVALAHALDGQAEAHATFRLRADGGRLPGFTRGLAAALQPYAPDISRTVASMQLAAARSETPQQDLQEWFCSHLRSFAGILTIDDFHLAGDDEEVCAFLVGIIKHAHCGIRWVIATRDTGALPVSVWLEQGHMGPPITEADLVLSSDEARQLSSTRNLKFDTATAETIRTLTHGWPAAFRFAVDLAARAPSLAAVTSGTREMMYRFLAEQVFNGLDEREQTLLLATCVYGRLDTRMLVRAGYEDSPQIVAGLRRRTSFMYAESEHIFRYHDLFREFLEDRLRSGSSSAYSAALENAGSAFQQEGQIAEAFQCYMRGKAQKAVADLLEVHGVELIDGGKADVAEAALDTVGNGEHMRPRILALVGMVAANRGELASAVSAFDLALDRAEGIDERAWIAYYYARSTLSVQEPKRIAALLAAFIGDVELPKKLDALICSLLAGVYVRLNCANLAQPLVSRALKLLPLVADEDVRATVYHRAGFCASIMGDAPRAKELSLEALRMAETTHNFRIAGVSYHILNDVTFEFEDDREQCRSYLLKCEEVAERSGNVEILMAALWHRSLAAAELGDEGELHDLDGRLDVLERRIRSLSMGSWLLSQALRAAWQSDFEQAYQLVGSACELAQAQAVSWRALCTSLAALYAAAAGKREEALAAVDAAERALAAGGDRAPSRCIYQALCFCALALTMTGQPAAASYKLELLACAPRFCSERIRALEKAVRALFRQSHSGLAQAEVIASLDALQASGFGGYATLFRRLPLPGAEGASRLASLTPAERDILAALGSGATSREIAARSGRRKSTIDGHVESLRKKLGCANRREAIALARKQAK